MEFTIKLEYNIQCNVLVYKIVHFLKLQQAHTLHNLL